MALHSALQSLYDERFLQLAKEGDELFTFGADIVSDAVKALHKAGKFSPKLLAKKEGRALIGENYRILSDAIDTGTTRATTEGLTHEIPAELTAALKDNAYIFSGWKAYHTMREAGVSLMDAGGGMKTFEQFEKEAGDVFKRQNLNLRAEYQYATQTAQMVAKWHDIEEDGDRYDLQYRTVGDDRVREEHAALDGTTLPPSDPFWSKYYPPNGWGCRCTAVQVRKGKYEQSDSQAATDAGDDATSQPRQQMFRFNAGAQKKIFPNKHPYFPKDCGGCDKTLALVYGKGRPECETCKIVKAMSAAMETIPTKRGVVKCSRAHGANERAENIAIAKHFAEKHGQEIELLPRAFNKKTPDAYNKTLGVEQEFKVNKTPTKSAIDNELRKAGLQANHIVLSVESDIPSDQLKRGVKGRIKWAKNIEALTIVRNGKDRTYTREEILSDGFEP